MLLRRHDRNTRPFFTLATPLNVLLHAIAAALSTPFCRYLALSAIDLALPCGSHWHPCTGT